MNIFAFWHLLPVDNVNSLDVDNFDPILTQSSELTVIVNTSDLDNFDLYLICQQTSRPQSGIRWHQRLTEFRQNSLTLINGEHLSAEWTAHFLIGTFFRIFSLIDLDFPFLHRILGLNNITSFRSNYMVMFLSFCRWYWKVKS